MRTAAGRTLGRGHRLFRTSRDAARKLGGTVAATTARLNVAEILIDRGEWAEAETMLLEMLPVWKASGYQFYLGTCLEQSGRVATRLGRFDDALARFEAAKASYLHVGAEQDIPPITAWMAECRVRKGEPDAALALVEELPPCGHVERSRADGAVSVPRAGTRADAAGRPVGRARRARRESRGGKGMPGPFEATLTSLSLIELDRLEGVEPPLELIEETRSLLASRKVRAVRRCRCHRVSRPPQNEAAPQGRFGFMPTRLLLWPDNSKVGLVDDDVPDLDALDATARRRSRRSDRRPSLLSAET